MNINKLSISTSEAINARKVSLGALEEALRRKIHELREVCLKEGEITGQLPVEYPLQPREPLPQIRRTVEFDFSKEPPKRTVTATSSKQITTTIPNKTLSSSSALQKHSISHAIKPQDDNTSPLGDFSKTSKFEDVHRQILQIQKSSYDSSRSSVMTSSSTRSDGNFNGIGSSSHEGFKYHENRLESIHNRNHSETSIDQVEKIKYKQRQASLSRNNRDLSGTSRNGHYPRSDVSSISIKTMIQPTNNPAFGSRKYDDGQSKSSGSQCSQQSLRLANLHKEILKLQASHSNQTSIDKSIARSDKASSSGKLEDSDIGPLDRFSKINHERVVSDGCSYNNCVTQHRPGVSTVQSADFSISKSIVHRSSDQSFNITEIPAESNRGSSPTISSSDSIGDENSNPLTSKISQLSITGVGNFQPYWEETKPYELSDFYKYSAKHRTGGKAKKNNISERIENLEQTIAAKSNHRNQDRNGLFRERVASDSSDNNNRNTTINNNVNNGLVHNAHFQTSHDNKISGSSHSPSIHDHNFVNEQQSTSSHRTKLRDPSGKLFPTLKNDCILRAASGQSTEYVPVWIMRQAGRYLPEFKELRLSNPFFKICETPQLACQVTLMPMKRFDLDAAIIFSDILVIPQALGMVVEMTHEGPKFPKPLRSIDQIESDLKADVDIAKRLSYVYEAITLTRHSLEGKCPLIGFSGAPWTLMGYMVEGGGSKTMSITKRWLYQHPSESHSLLKLIGDKVTDYLLQQVKAGAQMLQLFESSAEYLNRDLFTEFALPYILDICKNLKLRSKQENLTTVPICVFAKGGHFIINDLTNLKDGLVDIVSLDWTMDPIKVRSSSNGKICLQGNMDPCALYAHPDRVRSLARSMIDQFGTQSYIANLGHGIYPDAKIECVQALIDEVHSYSRKKNAEL